MKCYNHPLNDAVGICKNCNKGLCKECIIEVENGIACKETCVEEVKLINSLINRNKKAYRHTACTFYRTGYIYGGLGLVFIFFGIFEGPKYFLIVSGIIFILGAIISLTSANKYKKG